jgi:hypothetical protein
VDIEATALGINHVHPAPREVATPHGIPVSCRISLACFRKAERGASEHPGPTVGRLVALESIGLQRAVVKPPS